jgi:hypothetical protein
MGKARAGRKRKVNVMRHPSGRVVERSDGDRERDVKSVVVQARVRHGLRIVDAEKAEAETLVGEALLRRYIDLPDKDQRERIIAAANEYESLSRQYRAVLGSKLLGSAGDYDKGPSYDGSEGDDPAYVERCQTIRRRFAECRSVLLHADTFAHMAVETWVIERKPAMDMIGELLVGLNALAKLFAGEGRIKG